jgi:penicillin-binding protein-related factor A (putative recombinase)
MFDKIKNLFKKPEPVKPVQEKKPRQSKKKKEDSVLSDLN